MRRCQRSPPSSVTWSPTSSSIRSCMPSGWRLAGRRRPCSAQKTPSGLVSNSGKPPVGALVHGAGSARRLSGRTRQLAQQVAQPPSLLRRGGCGATPRAAAARRSRGPGRPSRACPRAARPRRSPRPRAAQLARHLGGGPGLVEERAQPDRRLRLRDPDEAPGRVDAASDDARPALRHARRARRRVHAGRRSPSCARTPSTRRSR